MTVYLPAVSPALCVERLGKVFPRAAFDPVMSSPLAGAGLAAFIYLGAVEDPTDNEQRYARPSMLLWLNDAATAHDTPAERDAWYSAAMAGKRQVSDLEATWGLTFSQRYADNTRETLRDETLPKWREQNAMLKKVGLPTSSSRPSWLLQRAFADLFNPALTGDDLDVAIKAWSDANMTTSAKLKAASVHRLAQQGVAVEVKLPGGALRQLEPGVASNILKGVIEEWAPLKLGTPMVLTISEPGDKIYLADKVLLSSVGIEIDPGALLPDALLFDADSGEFWIVEAVNTDGPITDERKVALTEWAVTQGIPTDACRFLTAFTSRNDAPAKRRLKDLASGTFAWFLAEPGFELSWSEIEPAGSAPKLAVVTPING